MVDDCSDETYEEIKSYSAHLIRLEKRSGPGIARNIGVNNAKGEIIQFLDSDVIIPPDLLSKVYNYFKNSELDCLVGTYSEESPCKNTAGQFKNLFIRYTFLTLPPAPYTIHACVTAIRKNIFLESKGFDPRLTTAGIEDAKFGHELAKKGYKIKFSSDYYVTHLKCYTLFELARNDFKKGFEFINILLMDKEFLNMVTSKNQLNANRNFAITIPISFLLPVLSGYFFYSDNNLILLLLFICLFVYVIAQFSFLKYLAKINGYIFCFKSIPLLLINSYMFGFAVLFGYLRYLYNKIFF